MSPSRPPHGPKVKCQCCDGTGKQPLSAPLLRVYEAVLSGHQTAPEIFHHIDNEKDDLVQESINRRLEKLVDLGLLVRGEQKKVRAIVYHLAPAQQEQGKGLESGKE